MTWRTIPADLKRAGKPQTLRELGVSKDDANTAERLGLVIRTEGRPMRLVLTEIGADYCAGRVAVRHLWPCKYVVAATWLRALPQGLRLSA